MNTAFNAISTLAVLFLLIVAAYISFISPPTGDTWRYVLAAESLSPIGMIPFYIDGYLNNNPRLGQYMLSLAGYGQLATALVNAGSLALLLFGSAMVITGTLFRVSHAYLIVVIFATLIVAGTQIGQQLFYVPFTANYVFGFGLLIFFLGVVRVWPEARSWQLIPIAVLGFLAGLTNEHTPPAILGIGLLAILVSRTRLYPIKLHAAHYVAYLSLLVGYLSLFFAPGQTRRYGDSVQRDQGFAALFSDFQGRFESVASLFFANSVAVIVLAGALAIAVLIISARQKITSISVLPMIALILSFGMAATVLASPLVGQRLLFASYVLLGISVAASLYYVRRIPFLVPIATFAAAVISAHFLIVGVEVHDELNRAYQAHQREIQTALDDGVSDARFDRYFNGFRQNSEYLRQESFSIDPSQRLNRLRAQIYGFDTFAYLEP